VRRVPIADASLMDKGSSHESICTSIADGSPYRLTSTALKSILREYSIYFKYVLSNLDLSCSGDSLTTAVRSP
jgi:hypothetical protein